MLLETASSQELLEAESRLLPPVTVAVLLQPTTELELRRMMLPAKMKLFRIFWDQSALRFCDAGPNLRITQM
jgi:hypothetical protein